MNRHLKSLIALVGALCVLGLASAIAEDNTTRIINGTVSNNGSLDYNVGQTGTNLDLTWPESYLGWYAQSNALSLTDPNSWFEILGSQTATNLTVTIDPAVPQAYYRMRYPQ